MALMVEMMKTCVNKSEETTRNLSPGAAATDHQPALPLLPEHAGAEDGVGEGRQGDRVGAAAKHFKRVQDRALKKCEELREMNDNEQMCSA